MPTSGEIAMSLSRISQRPPNTHQLRHLSPQYRRQRRALRALPSAQGTKRPSEQTGPRKRWQGTGSSY
ncbi:hypothetical protein HBH74_241330 [Parastagonospora nodorum]|nr:hypothetical protein HBH74_241330 [Parastagonospora nodorum]KAH5451339.1 hypothetical protein HBI31_241490 [Parastagonospora nodorum]KAH5706171.1 hypothetical protein HBI20_222690 [Parastagonospora nodorum]KAH5994298.1 hypothetical protein HBI83_245600 [Parastagonospora nodorum]